MLRPYLGLYAIEIFSFTFYFQRYEVQMMNHHVICCPWLYNLNVPGQGTLLHVSIQYDTLHHSHRAVKKQQMCIMVFRNINTFLSITPVLMPFMMLKRALELVNSESPCKQPDGRSRVSERILVFIRLDQSWTTASPLTISGGRWKHLLVNFAGKNSEL